LKAFIQRVSQASVNIKSVVHAQIGAGLAVFVGVARDDTDDDIAFVVNKTVNLRIFSDDDGKFNLSCREVGGQILLVSQFTLFADIRKGNRPSFFSAAPPEEAKRMFQQIVDCFIATGLTIKTGQFQEHMLVGLSNDGPVSLLVDSMVRHDPRRSAN
jgi:D-tyrosyl-tRNA(Tyr) deacylase